jgi:hypothetical protein
METKLKSFKVNNNDFELIQILIYEILELLDEIQDSNKIKVIGSFEIGDL